MDGVTVDKKWILKKNAYYLEVLEDIGGRSLFTEVTIPDLDLPAGIRQTAYNDMKAIGFKDGMVNFFCFISSEMVSVKWEESIKTPEKFVKKIPDYGVSDLDRRDRMIFGSIMSLFRILIANENQVYNTVRLFFRHPEYFFKTSGFEAYSNIFYDWVKKKYGADYFGNGQIVDEAGYIVYDSIRPAVIYKFFSGVMFARYYEKVMLTVDGFYGLQVESAFANYFWDDFRRMLDSKTDWSPS